MGLFSGCVVQDEGWEFGACEVVGGGIKGPCGWSGVLLGCGL
jgi:hypothetical protein